MLGDPPGQRLTGQLSWTDHSLVSLQYGRLPHHLCRASCSLSDHIRRLFLGLDGWLISGIALDTAPCKWSSPAAHIIIIWHVLAILIRLCCYQSTYMIGGGYLMQLSYGSKSYISPIFWNKTELPPWIYLQKAITPILSGWTRPHLEFLSSLPSWSGSQWVVRETVPRKIQKYF